MPRRCHVAWCVVVGLAGLWGLGSPAMAKEPESKTDARPWVIYLLPHSHIDIGFTHLQPEVARRQCRNIDQALDLCEQTANYPAGARFKWNIEVLWPVDNYMRTASPEQRQRFVNAVRAGNIELDALYANELTALCRPEGLMRMVERSAALAQQCGVQLDSAMISDVPGATWGIVPVLAEAGVKYFSIGPNSADRIGRTMVTWQDKPFYWVAPDRRHKVLCWVPYRGYSFGFVNGDLLGKLGEQIDERIAVLEKSGYPYDIVQLRWSCQDDNGPPDARLPDFVKDWNAAHDSPKLVIATTGELFREFERRYGKQVPEFAGDFTPYWEDGAGSSARETAINRTAAERLLQDEAVWSLVAPNEYPATEFSDAWHSAILYDEHTWGAFNSITQPDAPFVKEQWKIKQAFALDADAQSKKLFADAVSRRAGRPVANAVDVINTTAWPRTDLVVLDKQTSAAGDVVMDSDGKALPSQRLSTGELAFLAGDVPAMAAKRFTVGPGKVTTLPAAEATDTGIQTASLSITVDPTTGVITSLRGKSSDIELCDMRSGIGLNQYVYVLGDRVKEAQTSGPAKISVKETGPLVASLLIESDAPGCANLRREIRMVDGLERIEITNTIDKTAVREKEGVHFGFSFNVPNGVMRMDIPWAVMQPEVDQIPASCKNWFTVGRWADVSNDAYGVTWATLDAPLVEIGRITADRIGPQSDPNVWLDAIAPSQTFFSWVMNNHWHTNYRADQEGSTAFRYAIAPHRKYDPMAAQRLGIECSQPLMTMPAVGDAPDGRPLVELDTPDVLLASIKPSNDGKAWIVRLFGASGKDRKATLRWGAKKPTAVSLSTMSEQPGNLVHGAVDVPAFEIVTLRAELP